MKIKKIYYTALDTRKVLPYTKESTVYEFAELWDGLAPELKNKDRILLNDIIISVTLKDKELRYTLRRGWITDFASVPEHLRSFVDNDDYRLIVAALVHDANFACHYLSFKESNELFRAMIRKAGGSWWMGFKAYWGVNNWIGKRNYRNQNKPKFHYKFTQLEIL